MKRLFFMLALLVGVAANSNAQKYTPGDFNYAQAITPYLAHSGFGYKGLGDGNFMIITNFQNYTGETLEVHFKIPKYGIDKVFSVLPTGNYGEYNEANQFFDLGLNWLPQEASQIRPFLVEIEVNQPGYNFSISYVWWKGLRKYYN